jgi:Na+-transporting NADH:ubiquinone oxidoreductase subunit NqrE
MTLLSRVLYASAGLGCVLLVLNVLRQAYGIVDWGVTNDWHFTNLLGWGFGWLFTLELHILALLLVTPYWLFAGSEVPGRRRFVNGTVMIGLLLFALLSFVETQLQTSFP